MEGQEFSSPNSQEILISATKFKTPYCQVTYDEVKKNIPQEADSMKIVLQEIDRQAAENFQLFESKKFPGTKFSYIPLRVTPEAVSRIAQNQNPNTTKEQALVDAEPDGKNEAWFIFTAFGKPPDGNAYGAQDIGIDRFVRFLPKIAKAIREGKKPPEVAIYLIGAGTGFGEKVSPELVDEFKKRGFDAKGEMYAEFIGEVLPQDTRQDTHVVLQGASMGSTTADKTYEHLPQNVKDISQRLFDIPAGTHKPGILGWLKGAQAGIGLLSEAGIRAIGDNTVKGLNRGRDALLSSISQTEGFEADSKEQEKLKNEMVRYALLKLGRGSLINFEERSFVRERVEDPLTSSPKKILEKLAKLRKPAFSQEGHALKSLSHGTHFFAFENYKRWEQIMKYCKNTKPQEDPKLSQI